MITMLVQMIIVIQILDVKILLMNAMIKTPVPMTPATQVQDAYTLV